MCGEITVALNALAKSVGTENCRDTRWLCARNAMLVVLFKYSMTLRMRPSADRTGVCSIQHRPKSVKTCVVPGPCILHLIDEHYGDVSSSSGD